MRIIIFLITLFNTTLLFGQQVLCIETQPNQTSDEADINIREMAAQMGNPSSQDLKIIRINIHYLLPNDGTRNFTETHDNDGLNYSGYEFARDLTDWMNERYSYNVPQNIPPNNTVLVADKKWGYALEAVYFHRNDQYAVFGQASNYHGIYGRSTDSVMHIYFASIHPIADSGVGGYATNTSLSSLYKYTENRACWYRYFTYKRAQRLGLNDQFAWVMHGVGANIIHELGHLHGLSHTVRFNNRPPCPTMTTSNPPSINYGCDDGCRDTPSAWYIDDTLGLNHPACGWNTGSNLGCSNNLMDYNGDNALSPCQLKIMHSGAMTGLVTYNVCKAVLQPTTICDIGFPKTSYYGSNVQIGSPNCGSSAENLSGEEYATVYFSSAIDFQPFEVRDTASFEVIYHKPCP